MITPPLIMMVAEGVSTIGKHRMQETMPKATTEVRKKEVKRGMKEDTCRVGLVVHPWYMPFTWQQWLRNRQ